MSSIDDLVKIVTNVQSPLETHLFPFSGSTILQDKNQVPVVTYDGVSEEMTEEQVYHRRIGVIEADIESNCIEHGVRGILKHEDIQAMIAEYSDEDKQARIYGKFQHLTGLVYKEFTRKVHVIRPFLPRPVNYCVLELLDPHPRLPDAVMWLAIDASGRKFIVDELYEKVESTEELAYKIKQKGSQYRIIQRRADPLAWNTNQHDPSKRTLAKELFDLGLSYVPASKDRSMGIQLTHNALSYQATDLGDREEIIKSPMLYIFETCVRTIWELEHWQYNEWTGKAAEKRNQSEKPQDKDDHMMENLGRGLLDEPRFVPMPRPSYAPQYESIPTTDPYG